MLDYKCGQQRSQPDEKRQARNPKRATAQSAGTGRKALTEARQAPFAPYRYIAHFTEFRTMQAIQHILALAIEAIAVIGFGGIYLHHLYTQHTRWMQEHCPPVEPYNPDACLIRPACVLTCALPELPQETATATPEASPETAIPATDPAPAAPAPKRTRSPRKPKAEATPKTTKPKTSARKPRKPKNPSLISD